MIEDNITEFKREVSDSIKYAVIAFLNTDGGTLYIGVNDDGSVRGLENIDHEMLRVTDMLRNSIRPDVTMFVNPEVHVMDGKHVIVVKVHRGTGRPYYLVGKGVRPEGVYVRHGASSVPASETMILNMIKETSGDRYEDARSLNQELSFKKTASFFAGKNLAFGDAQLHTLNIIGHDGTYTNLGLLLSDECAHSIKIAVFNGSKKTVFKDRKELSGSLFEQLESAYAFIDYHNRTRSEFEGLYRVDSRDYPPAALREALLNALVHRDYSISGSTLISIFDDRIEILNIGGLVKGLSYGDMMLGVSSPRNKHLAEIFYRLELIEAYGTGVMKIKESYADYSVKPVIEVSDNAFKVTLPNTNYVKEVAYYPTDVDETPAMFGESEEEYTAWQPTAASVPEHPNKMVTGVAERERLILDFLRAHAVIGRKDVEALLGVSQPTAVRILVSLLDKGLLVKEGASRNVRYRRA